MTAAPALVRARRFDVAIAIALASGALAIAWTIFSAAPSPAFADAVARGTAMLANHRISAAFGPETAAAGADGGAIGWLAALASAVLAASALGRGAGAFVASACALGGIALVASRIARIASPRIVIAATALALATSIDALQPGLAATPLLFAAALAVAFDVPGPRGIAAVGIVTLLWCQVDPAGVLAPAFALANVAARALERSDRATLRTELATLAVAALATLATPEGIRFPQLAFDALQLVGGSGGLVAWAPTDVAARAYRGGFSLVLACALVVGLRARGPRDAAFAIVAIVLAFGNGNLLPVAAVFVVPVLAAAAQRALGERAGAARIDVTRGGIAAVACVAVALSLVVGLAYRGVAATRVPAEPYRALERVAAARDVRVVACVRVAWCDVAVGLGMRVLADDRVGAMPDRVRDAQLAIGRAKPSWSHEADAARVDAIVVASRAPLAMLLDAAGWHRVAPARDVSVFVRPGRRP